MRPFSVPWIALAFTLTACASGSNSQSQSSPTSSPSPPPPAVSAGASPTPTSTSDPLAGVQFTDIAGNAAETAIKQEAALDVYGAKTGEFKPDDRVTRAQYVGWLVTANNIYFKDTPQGQIRLATTSADQTFVDVPKSNALFAQIEGMADAGYVVGIDKNHFAPDRPLTREELIAIQANRYKGGGAFDATTMYCVHLTDANQISKPYWGAFNYDQCTGFNGQDDLHRIFGAMTTLHPQRPVTKAEVAIALQKIAGRTAAQALPH